MNSLTFPTNLLTFPGRDEFPDFPGFRTAGNPASVAGEDTPDGRDGSSGEEGISRFGAGQYITGEMHVRNARPRTGSNRASGAGRGAGELSVPVSTGINDDAWA